MKKRIRYYAKRGWTVIVLEGASFNVSNYHSALAWCQKTFSQENWAAKLIGGSTDSKFVFRHERDATLFSLRWLDQ